MTESNFIELAWHVAALLGYPRGGEVKIYGETYTVASLSTDGCERIMVTLCLKGSDWKLNVNIQFPRITSLEGPYRY